MSIGNSGYIGKGGIFSRDCLEIDVEINHKVLTFLVNHFKAQEHKESSIEKRKRQAAEVSKIAKMAADEGKYPIVLGDLNMDIHHPLTPGDHSLDSLMNLDFLKDPFTKDMWTHYYVPEKSVSRLDYILIVTGTIIIRKGLTTKCKQYEGIRYPTIGQEHTEASDHCPVSATIEL